jgi:hypothetical protein
MLLATVLFEEYLKEKKQGGKGIATNNKRDTYTSTLTSSSVSSVFLQVGYHIGMSKYFTRKGQTTVSRARNGKNLVCKSNMSKLK